MRKKVEFDQNTPLGERVQVLLRNEFGRDAAKKSASITDAEIRTSRGWVEEGREPRGWHLLAIIKHLGRDGLLALFSPEIDDHAARIERQIDELEEEAARLRTCLDRSKAAAGCSRTEAALGVAALEGRVHAPRR